MAADFALDALGRHREPDHLRGLRQAPRRDRPPRRARRRCRSGVPRCLPETRFDQAARARHGLRFVRVRRPQMAMVVPCAAASSRMPMMLLPSIVRPSRRDADLRPIARGDVHELRRRARVQAQPVRNHHLARRHPSAVVAAPAGDEPFRRSVATQMALRPCSRSYRATSARSCRSRRLAALISIGRFTPVTTSTLSLAEERHAEVRRRAAEHVGGDEHAALAPLHARDRRCDLVARVLHVLVPADRHRGERGRSPTMVSAALTSSVARCPWVTTTTPIMPASPSRGGGRAWSRPSRPPARASALRPEHRAMPAAGAADGHRQIRLAFVHVVRHEVAQEPSRRAE